MESVGLVADRGDMHAGHGALLRAGGRTMLDFVHFEGPLPPPEWRGDELLRQWDNRAITRIPSYHPRSRAGAGALLKLVRSW